MISAYLTFDMSGANGVKKEIWVVLSLLLKWDMVRIRKNTKLFWILFYQILLLMILLTESNFVWDIIYHRAVNKDISHLKWQCSNVMLFDRKLCYWLLICPTIFWRITLCSLTPRISNPVKKKHKKWIPKLSKDRDIRI